MKIFAMLMAVLAVLFAVIGSTEGHFIHCHVARHSARVPRSPIPEPVASDPYVSDEAW
uniref:Uncharacterized protein n=1 Tax=Procambarus clarkii TaxID=6728 RepID=F5A6D0_PROCL|nr:hypothetical protein [Procambarus clarkii]